MIYNGETAVQMFGSLGIDFDLSEYQVRKGFFAFLSVNTNTHPFSPSTVVFQDFYGPEMATSYATCYG